jgi:DNA adenine methylase
MIPERPVLRYFGGKWMLAPWIISQFPPHRIYVEPFGGGASILMRKPRVYSEVYNDLDGEVVNVFRVLRDKALSQDLERQIRLTPFSREEFFASYEQTTDPVERARRTIIRSFMGFGSNSVNREAVTGFRANALRSGTTPAIDWSNYPDEIPAFHERMSRVVIENRDYREVMLQQDTPETLFLVDPPYVPSTRSEKHGYRHEMDLAGHEDLVRFLPTIKGMVILCGYENDTYEALGWRSIKREAHADGARDRVEVLWMNAAAADAQNQMRLFESC